MLCFVLDLRCLSPPRLRDLKQSLLQVANFNEICSSASNGNRLEMEMETLRLPSQQMMNSRMLCHVDTAGDVIWNNSFGVRHLENQTGFRIFEEKPIRNCMSLGVPLNENLTDFFSQADSLMPVFMDSAVDTFPVGHSVSKYVDRILTIDKENAQHKIASRLLCFNNSADKFVSVEFVDVWEHVSEKIWIEAFCKSCWKWMHVNIEANVLGLFFRSAIGHLKEAGLSEELSQLLKFVESRLQLSYGGISLMEELRRLMSQLDLKADFSEFSHLYDFVFFICCYGILWDIMQETPPSSSKRSFHGGSILQLRTGNSEEASQGSVCCLVQALNRGAKKIHVHNEQVSLMRTTADGGIQVEEASFYLTSILSFSLLCCNRP